MWAAKLLLLRILLKLLQASRWNYVIMIVTSEYVQYASELVVFLH